MEIITKFFPALFQSPWWVWISGTGSIVLAIVALKGYLPVYERLKDAEPASAGPSNSTPSVVQTANGDNGILINNARDVIITQQAKSETVIVELPTILLITDEGLTPSSAVGNPPTEYAKKFYKQRELVLTNPNPFPLQDIVFRFQFPEALEPMYNITKPPGVNVVWKSPEGSRMTGNFTQVGDRPWPNTCWNLEVDRVPPRGAIRILFFTTTDSRVSCMVLFQRKMSMVQLGHHNDGPRARQIDMGSMLAMPDDETRGIVDFVVGNFNYNEGNAVRSKSVVSRLKFLKSPTPILLEEDRHQYNLLNYGFN